MTLFDKILWRFNGVVIGLGCVFVLISMALAVFGICRSFGVSPASIVSPNAKQKGKNKDTLSLNQFRRIQGTDWLVACLSTRSNFSSFGSSSSYDYSGYGVRNYLFFDARSGNSRWLAQNNASCFVSEHALHEDPTALTGKLKTTGFIYEVVPANANGDQKSTADPSKSIVFYNLSTATTRTLVDNVAQVLGVEQVSKDEAIVLFRSESKDFALSVKANSGEQIAKRELPVNQTQ